MQINPPNNKFYWYLIGVCLLVLCIILWPKSCNHEVVVNPVNEVIKERVKVEKKLSDSTDKVIKKKDSIRVIYKERWRIIRYDSLIPCLEKLVLADTIIQIDSSEITSLKASNYIKGIIIKQQDTIIHNDSIALRKANKRLKRQRVLTKLIAIVGGIGIVAAIVK